MRQYLNAVQEVLERGTRKENRTGVDTISTFNINYEIYLSDGFPLLTTKAINWKNIVVENLWFLSGCKDISLLRKHGCKFWDHWADSDGKVPSAYGNFWRHFPVHGKQPQMFGTDFGVVHEAYNDQIQWVVSELKRNPMSRRCVVSAWAPGNAQTSKLPPCHAMFVLNVQNTLRPIIEGSTVRLRRELDFSDPWYRSRKDTTWIAEIHHEGGDLWGCNKGDGYCEFINASSLELVDRPTHPALCLHLTQRSCDIALGVPYNIAGYALLLELFGRFTGIKPGVFAHTLVDAHIYTSKPDGSMSDHDHIPGLRMQLARPVRALPRLVIDPSIESLSDIDRLLEMETDELMRHFQLVGYDPWPAISFKVAV